MVVAAATIIIPPFLVKQCTGDKKKLDKSPLEEQIRLTSENIVKYDGNEYQDIADFLKAAKEQANKVKNNAQTQSQLDTETLSLENDNSKSVSLKKLQDTIAVANEFSANLVDQTERKNNLDEQIKIAQTILDNGANFKQQPPVTKQQVDKAQINLSNLLCEEALKSNKIVKDQVEQYKDNLEAKYPELAEELMNALKDNDAVINKENQKATFEEIMQATKKLQNALKKVQDQKNAIDKSALKAAIDNATKDKEFTNDDSAIAKEIQDAIDKANEVYNKTNPEATETELSAAKDELDKKVNNALRDYLKDAIEKAKQQTLTTEDPIAKAKLEDAIEVAQATLDKDPKASDEELKKAKEDLAQKSKETKDSNDVYLEDEQKLKDLIDQAEDKSSKTTNPEIKEAIDAAIEEVQKVINKDPKVTDPELKEAIKDLTDALDDANQKQAETIEAADELQKAIDNAKKLNIENPEAEIKLEDAIVKAQSIHDDPNSTKEQLSAAKDELEKVVAVVLKEEQKYQDHKKILIDSIKNAIEKKSLYNAEEQEEIQKAIDNANQTLDKRDPRSTMQQLIDAKIDLEKVIAKIEKKKFYGAFEQAKKEATDFADEDLNDDSYKNIKDELQKVIDQQSDIVANSDVTQEQIDDATKVLEAALDNAKNLKEKLDQAKKDALEALEKMDYLNPKEKADAQENIKKALNVADVQELQDQAQKLNDDKKAQAKEVLELENLSPKVLEDFDNAIKNAEGVEAAGTIKDTAIALDKQVETLNTKILQVKNVKNESKYINATQEQKDAFDLAFKNATDALNDNKLLVGHDQDNVKTLEDELTKAFDNLQGEDNLKNAKNQAIADIDKMPYLNDKEKADAKTQINDETTDTLEKVNDIVAESQKVNDAKEKMVETILDLQHLNLKLKENFKQKVIDADGIDNATIVKNEAIDLDTSAGELTTELKKAKDEKETSNYLNATPKSKKELDEAIAAAEEVLDDSTLLKPGLDLAKVNQLTDDLKNKLKNLNGDDKLKEAKKSAKSEIENDEYLSPKEKADAVEKIVDAKNIDNVNKIKDAANKLNYDKKAQADEIQKLPELNQELKDQYIAKIKKAEGVQAATTLKEQAKALNDATTALKVQLKEALNNKESSNYTNATKESKKSLDEAIDAAKDALDNADSKDLTQQLLKPGSDLSKVEQLTEDLKQGLDQLNGEDQLAAKKANAIAAIDKLEYLNGTEKTKAKNAVKDAKLVNDVINAKKAAEDLNNAKKAEIDPIAKLSDLSDALKGELKKEGIKATAQAGAQIIKETANELNNHTASLLAEIAKAKNVQTTSQYINATEDEQNKLKTALENVKAVLSDNKLVPGHNKDELQTLEDALKVAYNNLSGVQQLKDEKKNAEAEITNMPYLSETDKNDANSEISGANTIEEIDKIKEKAQKLNNDKEKVADYIKNNLPELSLDVTNEFDQKVKDAIGIDGANEIKDQAQVLNDATGVLKAKIKEAETKKSTDAYIDATKDSKAKFDKALDNANKALDATKKLQLNNDIDKVNELKDELNKVLNSLNGDKAKAAKENIDANEYLTTAEKNKFKEQIDNATTDEEITQALDVANKLNSDKKTQADEILKLPNLSKSVIDAYVQKIKEAEGITKATAIKDEAKELDDATALLKDEIVVANVTINSDKYNNATTPSKEKFDVALKTAEDALEGKELAGKLLLNHDKDNVETLEANLKAALNQLNGQKAQTAKDTIDNLTYLSDDEKNTAKAEIDNAIDNQAIDDALKKAKALNQDKKTIVDQILALKHLNENVKNAYKEKVINANELEKAKKLKEEATTLDNAAGNLAKALKAAKAKQVSTNSNYVNATKETKDNFDAAITAAKSALDNDTLLNEGNDLAKVTKLTNDLNGALNQLNGDEQLNNAKDAAKAEIENNEYLSDKEKVDAKAEIENAQTISDVNAAKDKANTLNKNKEAIAKDVLVLKNLNETVKKQFVDQIKNSQGTNKAQSIKDTATNLDTAAANLKKELAKAKEKQSDQNPNYINATQKSKTALDDAIIAAKNALDNSDNNELTTQLLKPKNDQTQVEKLQADLQKALLGLDGNDQLAKAKSTANEMINNMYYLSLNEKTAAKLKVADATTIEVVNKAKNDAQDLNDYKKAQATLIKNLPFLSQPIKDEFDNQIKTTDGKQFAQDLATKASDLNASAEKLINKLKELKDAKTQIKYTEATPALKTAYDKALAAATAVVTSDLLDKNTNADTSDKVDELLTNLTNTYDALDGEKRLADAKEAAKDAISKMPYLTAEQIEQAKVEINDSNINTLAKVQDIQDKYQSLNDSQKPNFEELYNQKLNEIIVDFVNKQTDQNNIVNAENEKTFLEKAKDLINRQKASQSEFEQAYNELNSAWETFNKDTALRSTKLLEQTNLINFNYQKEKAKLLSKDLRTYVNELPSAPRVYIPTRNKLGSQKGGLAKSSMAHIKDTYTKVLNSFDNLITEYEKNNSNATPLDKLVIRSYAKEIDKMSMFTKMIAAYNYDINPKNKILYNVYRKFMKAYYSSGFGQNQFGLFSQTAGNYLIPILIKYGNYTQDTVIGRGIRFYDNNVDLFNKWFSTEWDNDLSERASDFILAQDGVSIIFQRSTNYLDAYRKALEKLNTYEKNMLKTANTNSKKINIYEAIAQAKNYLSNIFNKNVNNINIKTPNSSNVNQKWDEIKQQVQQYLSASFPDNFTNEYLNNSQKIFENIYNSNTATVDDKIRATLYLTEALKNAETFNDDLNDNPNFLFNQDEDLLDPQNMNEVIESYKMLVGLSNELISENSNDEKITEIQGNSDNNILYIKNVVSENPADKKFFRPFDHQITSYNSYPKYWYTDDKKYLAKNNEAIYAAYVKYFNNDTYRQNILNAIYNAQKENADDANPTSAIRTLKNALNNPSATVTRN